MNEINVVLHQTGQWEVPLRAALGSLSRTFAIRRTPPKDQPWVAAVDGGPGWPATIVDLASQGAAGIVVILPTPQPPSTFEHLRGAHLPPILVQTPWSANPGLVRGLASTAAWDDGRVVPEHPRLLDSRLLVPAGCDLDAVLASHLALLRVAFGQVERVEHLSKSTTGYVARLRFAIGVPGTASAVTSDAERPHGELLAVGATAMVRATLPWWTSAVPALVTRTDAEGSRVAPAVYESALRATWRRAGRLLDPLTPITVDHGDLDSWAHDQTLAYLAVDGLRSVVS